IARRYTSRPRPERDPNALRSILHAVQRGDLAAHDRDAVATREYWGGRSERDLRDLVYRGLWFRRADVLKVWPSHAPARPPSRLQPFWSDFEAAIIKWLVDNGAPRPRDGNQARLEDYGAEWLQKKGYDAAESTIRRHVRTCIKRYREDI